MYNSVVFTMFTELCNYHHNFRTFSSPRKEMLYLLVVTSYFPPNPLDLDTHSSSFSLEFLTLGIWNKLSRTLCGLLWLTLLPLTIVFSRLIHVTAGTRTLSKECFQSRFLTPNLWNQNLWECGLEIIVFEKLFQGWVLPASLRNWCIRSENLRLALLSFGHFNDTLSI